MRHPLKVLPQLDGTRAATDARLSAWLRGCSEETVSTAIDDALEAVNELHHLARLFITERETKDEAKDIARDAERALHRIGRLHEADMIRAAQAVA
jgi:hypothetical protein